MKKQFFLLSSLCLLLAACDQNANTSATVRDNNHPLLTPTDQSETEADRAITQKIRQILMDDDTLSTTAKNIKIITVDGITTLRGTVSNDREKNEIFRKARTVSGVKNVNNQLEIVRTER